MGEIRYKGQVYSGATIGDADYVVYDNTTSGLTSTNVQDALDEIAEGGGGGGSTGCVELTQAQYDALSDAEQMEDVIYLITDSPDNYLDEVFGDFASVEYTSTASKAYAVGDYLVYDSKFYKVTSAIAQGATIVPNTNVVKTTVADEFSNASNVDYSNTTSGLTATNVQSALDETASIIQARKNVLTTGSFSKAVTMRTQTTIGYISVPSGTHLVLTRMLLSNSGSSSYNHTLGNKTVRSTELNGGGSTNFEITTSATDLAVTAYTMSIDTTVVVHYAVIKLY